MTSGKDQGPAFQPHPPFSSLESQPGPGIIRGGGMNGHYQGGRKQQRKFGRHVVERDGQLFCSGSRFDLAADDRRSFLETKRRVGPFELKGGPSLDGKAVKLDTSALDQDGPFDKIDDDIGLRSSGQFDLFVEEPDRLLERAGIIGIETRDDIQLRGPAGHNEGHE